MRSHIINSILRGVVSIVSLTVVVSCEMIDESMDSNAPQYITFDTNIYSSSEVTRGTVVSSANKTTAMPEFGVYGYEYYGDYSINTTDLLFENQKVAYDEGSKVWTYTPSVAWPDGVDNALFYAYAPYFDVDSGDYYTVDGELAISDFVATEEKLSLKYDMPSKVESQPDILVSEMNYGISGTSVMLRFKHQLAAVSFNVVNNPLWRITKLTLINVASEATLTHTFATSETEWTLETDESSATKMGEFAVDIADYDPSSIEDGSEVVLSADDQTFIVIPHLLDDAVAIKVSIEDVNDASTTYDDVVLSIKDTTSEWVANNIYTYTLHIENGSVVFADDVSIVDWGDEINIGFTDDGVPQRVGYIDLDEITTVADLKAELAIFEATLVRKIYVSGTYWAGSFGSDMDNESQEPTNPFLTELTEVEAFDLSAMTFDNGGALPTYAFCPGVDDGNETRSSYIKSIVLPDVDTTVSEGLLFGCSLLSDVDLGGATVLCYNALGSCGNISRLRFGTTGDIYYEDTQTPLTQDNFFSKVMNGGVQLVEKTDGDLRHFTVCTSSTTAYETSSAYTSPIDIELYVGRSPYGYSTTASSLPAVYMAYYEFTSDGWYNVESTTTTVWIDTEWQSITYFGDMGVNLSNDVDINFYNTVESLSSALKSRVMLGYTRPVFTGDYWAGAFGAEDFEINDELREIEIGTDLVVSTDHYICQPNTASPLFSYFNEFVTIDVSGVSNFNFNINSTFSVDENAMVNKILLPPLEMTRPTIDNANAVYGTTFWMRYDDTTGNTYKVPDMMFAFCTHLSEANLYNSDGSSPWGTNITSIGRGAFMGCKMLNFPAKDYVYNTSLYPPVMDEIGDYAFYDCDQLLRVNNSTTSTTYKSNYLNIQSVNKIGRAAFAGCASLEYVAIAAGSIGDYAFAYNDSLYWLYLYPVDEDNLTVAIGDYAFAYDPSLKLVIRMSSAAVTLGEGAFAGCTGLQRLYLYSADGVLPARCFEDAVYDVYDQSLSSSSSSGFSFSGITKVGEECFKNCYISPCYSSTLASSYTSLSFMSNVTELGNRCFEGMYGYTRMDLSSVETIGSDIFKGVTLVPYTYINEKADSDGNYDLTEMKENKYLCLTAFGIDISSATSIADDAFATVSGTVNCTLTLPASEAANVSGTTWQGKTWSYISCASATE